ncbi:hypothetical protein DRQ50_00780 [bacterium]|nr:MAG: hypothetical protein DRQ50_00780 [bacterium]
MGRWDRREAAFRSDFLAAGETRVREAVRLADLRPEDNAETNQPLLTGGLHLVARSRIFAAEPASAVVLVKGLIRTAHRTGRPFPVDLLCHDLPFSAEDRLWLARKGVSMLEGFLEQDHMQPGSTAAHEWTQAVLRILDSDYFHEGARLEEERAWLEARTSDRLLGHAEVSLSRYADYLCLRPEPSPRSDEARVRMLEMQANIDKRHFRVPGYEAALGALQSAGLAPGSEAAGRYQVAVACIEYRRPEPSPGDESSAWATAALTSAGDVAVVIWWAGTPRDLALWRPGEDPARMVDFLAPCGGRVVAADGDTVHAVGDTWLTVPGPWPVLEYAAVFIPEAAGADGFEQNLARLCAAESGPWRADWRRDVGLPELTPVEDAGGDPASCGRALEAGLTILAIRNRVSHADPALRAGIGELARRGDPAADFLYPLLVHGDSTGFAVDQGFAPWTLPLLWTRPAPMSPATDSDIVVEAPLRPDLARNSLAIVTTGRPAPVIAAWCVDQHRWRVVLDRLDRLPELLPVVAASGGPVTVVPAGGAVHDLGAALALLENLLPGGSRDAAADLLAICHWRALVTTHNGDLLDGTCAAGSGAGPGSVQERYRELVRELPMVAPGQDVEPSSAVWAEQFSQRVRRAGCVLGLAVDLPGDPDTLDARWGVFEGSGASWIFLDAAAIRRQLGARREAAPAQTHELLYSRGDRHLALLTAAVWSRTDVEDLLAEDAAVFGSATMVALTDLDPPPLLLADRGVVAHARILRATALASAVEYLDRAVADGRPRVVLPYGGGATGDFWRQQARRLPNVSGNWNVVGAGEDPGAGRPGVVLCLPVMPGLDAEQGPPAGTEVAAWREADRLRHLAADAARRRASLEIAAHLAGRWDAVELLDPSWWHLLRPGSLAAGRGFGGEQALTASAAVGVRLIDLPGAGGREDPPSPDRARDVAQWCAGRGDALDLPAPATVHGLRLEVGRDDRTAAGLQSAVIAARESGDPDRWMLVVGDEPWLPAVKAVATDPLPGICVWPESGGTPVPGPVLWVRTIDLLSPDFVAFMKAQPPAAVVVPALESWLPGRGAGARSSAAALRILLAQEPPAMVLHAQRLPAEWSRFLVAVAGVDVVTAHGHEEPAAPDSKGSLPAAALIPRLRSLLGTLRSLLEGRAADCGSAGPAHLVSARELVPLSRLAHLTGLPSDTVRDGIQVLRWAASLAGDNLSTADAESTEERSSRVPGHALLIRRRFAECELALTELAGHLELFLPLWLGDLPAGGSTWIDLAAPPARIESAELRRLDTFLLEADPGAGLRCTAPRGVLGSTRRLLQLEVEPVVALSDTLRRLDLFRERLRDVMATAQETADGFLVETGLDTLREDEQAFLGLGAALDEWRWLGPVDAGALHVVDLLTLADSESAREDGPAWSLVGDLLGARQLRPEGPVDEAPRRAGWRSFLPGGEPQVAATDAVTDRVAQVAGLSREPRQIVLRGPAGTGRMRAVLDGLVAAGNGETDPAEVVVCCPDVATAARWNRQAVRSGLLLDVRVPGREDLPGATPGDALAAAMRNQVVVMCEAQRFTPERRYRVAQFGRGRRLVTTVDPAASTEGWENLFLTMPRADDIVTTDIQSEQARLLWSETRGLIPEDLRPASPPVRSAKGVISAEYAANLDQCLGRIRTALAEGLLPSSFRLTAPLADDLEHLGGTLRGQGWLAVDEEACDALMLPGPLELLVLAAAVLEAGSVPLEDGQSLSGAGSLLAGLPGAGPAAAQWATEWDGDLQGVTLADLQGSVACGDVLPVLSQPAARQRVRRLLANFGPRLLTDLAGDALWAGWWRLLASDHGGTDNGDRTGPGAVAGEGGRPLVLLATADRAPGAAMPGGVYLCLGSEDPRQHYRVLAGVTDNLLVLFQERSPLPSGAQAAD